MFGGGAYFALSAAALDDPVGDPSEDLLGRDGFALRLAALIQAGGAASFRLGVFGDWGDGKTSVLRLLERHLRAAGHACVWFTPWIYATVDAGWTSLLTAIARELGVTRAGLQAGAAARTLGARAAPGGDLAWKLRLAESALADSLRVVASELPRTEADERSVTGSDAGQSGESSGAPPAASGALLLDAIYGAVRGRRLVIFVDDLDRTEAALVPRLLLSLREVLDLPGFVYVVALSPGVVGEGLRAMHEGWGEPGRFLEKIVEVPAFVPQPREAEFSRALDGFLVRVGNAVRVGPVRAIAPLLPRNPRRLKLFLRYLASLRDVTDRFDDTEVDWERLYLCQLLRLEFPEEAHRLASDAEALKELESGKPREEMVTRTNGRAASAGTAVDPFTRADLRHAPGEKDPHRRSRFRALCDGLRDRGSFADSALNVAQMFRILEYPPILTWREYSRLWETLEPLLVTGPSDGAMRAVRDWLDAPPVGEPPGADVDASARSVPARLSELFRRTVQAREGQVGLAVGEETVAALTARLAEVDPFTALLRLIAIDLGGFRNGDLGVDGWHQLIGHLRQWAHFDRPAYHARVRGTEQRLLLDVASNIPANVAATVLKHGRDPDDRGAGLGRSARHGRRSPAWPRLLDKVYERLGATAAEAVLGAFAQPAGLRALFRADAPEARLLFDPESALHRPAARARLLRIARRATKDSVLRENVAAYFSRLTYGAFGEHYGTRSYLSRHDCQTLLRDRVLVAALWRAVVGRPLNPRSAGSLRETRRHLLALKVPEADLRLPSWFRSLERSGFWTDPTPEGGDQDDDGIHAVVTDDVPVVDDVDDVEGGEDQE